MPEKDPVTWSLATWALIMFVSFLGGITSWYRRVKEGHTRAFNIIELAGEMAISWLVGFTGFVVAAWYFESHELAAGIAGMSAHFATRIIFSAEGLIEAIFKRMVERINNT